MLIMCLQNEEEHQPANMKNCSAAFGRSAQTHTHTCIHILAESTATMESSLGYTSLIQLERSHIRIET